MEKYPWELAELADAQESIYQALLPHSNLGEDKQGRPVYWEKTGIISSRFSQIKKKLSEDEIFVRHVRQQEVMCGRFASCSAKHGRLINQQVIVFDMKGMSFSLDVMALRVFRRALVVDESCYPEMLHRLYMINAPYFFSAIWSIIRPWIDHKTAAKFHILGANYLDDLRESIELTEIPIEYGGLKEDFHWTWPDNISEKLQGK